MVNHCNWSCEGSAGTHTSLVTILPSSQCHLSDHYLFHTVASFCRHVKALSRCVAYRRPLPPFTRINLWTARASLEKRFLSVLVRLVCRQVAAGGLYYFLAVFQVAACDIDGSGSGKALARKTSITAFFGFMNIGLKVHECLHDGLL